MNVKQVFKLFICVLIPLSIGGISGYITSVQIPTWYTTLVKPGFNPPNAVFGPVWTMLYLLLGISLYIVTNTTSQHKKVALILFFIQLVLNFFWSIIFFNGHAIGLAAIEIILLWFCIILMIFHIYKISRWAALMNLPYLLWVSFATVLNVSIYVLN